MSCSNHLTSPFTFLELLEGEDSPLIDRAEVRVETGLARGTMWGVLMFAHANIEPPLCQSVDYRASLNLPCSHLDGADGAPQLTNTKQVTGWQAILQSAIICGYAVIIFSGVQASAFCDGRDGHGLRWRPGSVAWALAAVSFMCCYPT